MEACLPRIYWAFISYNKERNNEDILVLTYFAHLFSSVSVNWSRLDTLISQLLSLLENVSWRSLKCAATVMFPLHFPGLNSLQLGPNSCASRLETPSFAHPNPSASRHRSNSSLSRSDFLVPKRKQKVTTCSLPLWLFT